MKLNKFLEACSRGDLKAVKTGVKANRGVVNMRNEKGYTALYVACRWGQLETVKYLISAGSDKELRDEQGITPVFLASGMGHLEIVRILLSQGADKDKVDNRGATPLFIASQEGYLEIVRILLSEGDDKDKACHNETTPLFIASQQGHLEIVRLLLSVGADKDKANHNETTPLYVASQKGHLEIVQLLLSVGADKDKADTDVSTPLHAACFNSDTKTAKLLLLAGSSKEIINKFGRKALDLCPTEEMRAELEEAVASMSAGCAARRRRGRSCACCEVQEPEGVGTVGGPPKFQLCSACKGLAYCSATCQKLDWKARHKRECKVMQEQREKAHTDHGAKGEL